MPYPRAAAQTFQNCPMCGTSMTAGIMVCPNCGEDLTRASMVVSTTVRPLSRPVQRSVDGGSKTLYVTLACILVATAIVGLGYVPSVSARVPQLGALSSAVEEIVGQAVQWGREMIGQPPAPKPRAPVTRAPSPPVITPAKPPATKKPVVKPQGTPRAKPVQPKKPSAKSLPRPPAQKATPTAASSTKLLPVGARAPQFVLKDLKGVLYRLPDYQGRRVVLLFVSDLDQDGRTAIRAFINRFGNHPGYSAMVVVIAAQAERVDVRRLVAAGIYVPILLGEERLGAAYRVPKNGGVLYVVSEHGVISQARLIRGKQN